MKIERILRLVWVGLLLVTLGSSLALRPAWAAGPASSLPSNRHGATLHAGDHRSNQQRPDGAPGQATKSSKVAVPSPDADHVKNHKEAMLWLIAASSILIVIGVFIVVVRSEGRSPTRE